MSNSLSNPILATSGNGITSIGSSYALAQLDVVLNNTAVDLLLHVGVGNPLIEDSRDWFSVANSGYVGVGESPSGLSLMEISDPHGSFGSTVPLFTVDADNATTTPFFQVWGSSTGVNAGIGIDPIAAGKGSTLALQGVGGTTLDIFAGTGGGTGWDPQIRFYSGDGAHLRDVIVDDHSSNMLVIRPGYDGTDGAKNVVNIQGKLVIGDPGDLFTPSTTTDLSATYALIVRTGILTEMAKVAVRTTADWSDYVFDKDYKLPTFNALEDYIKTNKHLPDVPSAQQVVDNGGVDVAKMDAKLLQKIEELNLYVIQLEKENKKQDALIDELLKKVKIN